ncbi:glycosyltransferase [Gordonia iterans]
MSEAASETTVLPVERRLADYVVNKDDRGRSRAWMVGWLAVAPVLRSPLCSNGLRVAILRLFGAEIGDDCDIDRTFRVHYPWKLRVGAGSRIRRNVWAIDPEPITIGADCRIARDVVLCSGGHDFRAPAFDRTSAPLSLGQGCDVGAGATILKGVDIPERSQVPVGAVVTAPTKKAPMGEPIDESLRILQVVTLLAPDGAYGGPSTVAMNQAAELAARGHRVTLAAAVPDGYEPVAPTGVELRTFRVRSVGPSGSLARIAAPGMLRWLRRTADDFDVAHVHLGRDFVSAPAARLLQRRGVPLHVQTHGMLNPRSALPQQLVDRALVLPVLDDAATVFHLDRIELAKLERVGGGRRCYRELTNGVATDPTGGGEVTDSVPEILFLARLHERKRPAVFAEAARRIAQSGRTARFTVVGPDEGEAELVDRIFAEAPTECRDSLRREPAVSPELVLDRMRAAAVYVLPSVHEPLGMTVLEAMSVGLPVVVTRTCGLAPVIDGADAGIVVGDSVTELSDAIAALIDDPAAARAKGRRGRRVVDEKFGIGAVADSLEARYRNSRLPVDPRQETLR